MENMISIIIPLYNKADKIKKTLQSVLAQTYTDFEVIIVNDGSTDESVSIVEGINDSRIRLIHQDNAGVSAARNKGIQEAKGEFVAFLDADDVWMEDYLKTQIALIKNYSSCDVFSINYMFRDENGNTSHTSINYLPFDGKDGILTNYFVVGSASNPPLWTSSLIVRKTAIQSIGGFPLGIVTGEDLLTWARLACNYKIAYSISPKVFYELPMGGTLRVDPKDMSLKNDIVRKELLALLKKYKPLGWKAYISFWDKMRAIINIKKGERFECIKYALHSLFFNQLNVKSWALLVLSVAPQSSINKIIK